MNAPATFSPEIKEYIEKLVNEKIESRFKDFQQQISAAQQSINSLKRQAPKDKVTLLVMSHEMDKLLPAFIIAAGAASFGMEVSMFFTLWGINGLKDKSLYSGKNIKEMMLTMMLPDSPVTSGLSRMNMMGIGAAMMKSMLKDSNVESLPSLMNLAQELGVKMTACQMTMGIMGVKLDELRPGIHFGGVAAYIEDAAESKITLSF